MESLFTSLNVIGAIVVVLVIYAIAIYNRLIQLKNRFKNAYAQIDVQLQRRYDLIPNLVDTAKKYMEHEKTTLTQVIEARNTAKSAASATAAKPDSGDAMKALLGAETTLTSAMGRFFALAENYPDLKANQTMQQLMEELTTTENKISFARQAFNDGVMFYNTYRSQFPNVIISNLFAFKNAVSFEVKDEKVKEAVRVDFG